MAMKPSTKNIKVFKSEHSVKNIMYAIKRYKRYLAQKCRQAKSEWWKSCAKNEIQEESVKSQMKIFYKFSPKFGGFFVFLYAYNALYALFLIK